MRERERARQTGAESAFRRYAGYGFDRRGLRAFEVYDAIRGCCSDEETALDMLAVFDTLRLLVASGYPECADAIKAVYFDRRPRRPRKNDITHRVRRHAFERSFDERTVFRQLLRGKELYRYLRFGGFSSGPRWR